MVGVDDTEIDECVKLYKSAIVQTSTLPGGR